MGPYPTTHRVITNQTKKKNPLAMPKGFSFSLTMSKKVPIKTHEN